MENKKVPIMIAIQEKETELKVKVLEAKRQAEVLVAKARKESSKICQKARFKGEEEAKALVSAGLAKAKDEAEKMLASTEKTISSLNRLAKKNSTGAVDLVVLAVTGQVLKDKTSSTANRDFVAPTVSQEPGEIIEAADGGTDAR